VSRVPRFREHLKTGFTAEAATAATFRAYAARAEKSGRPKLAQKWSDLAREKDALAILQLEATQLLGDDSTCLRNAIAEENYENDVLYPKMIRDLGGETAKTFQNVVKAQQEHLQNLEELRDSLQSSEGDV
jgi:rubrerythrin